MSNPLARYANSGTNPVAGAVGAVAAAIFPEFTPLRTAMGVPPSTGRSDTSSQLLNQGVLPAVAANGGPGVVPWERQINAVFQSQFAGGGGNLNIAMIDTSHVTDDGTSTKDMAIDNQIFCAPYDDGAERQFDQYMLLFKLASDYTVIQPGGAGTSVAKAQKAPGFHTLATLPLLNQIQAKLYRSYRNNQLLFQSGGGALQRARTAVLRADAANDPLEENRAWDDARVKRRRAVPTVSPYLYGNSDRSVAARELSSLLSLGALDHERLYEKIQYLGPISQVGARQGTKCDPSASAGQMDHTFNYTYHGRGKVHNTFGTHPQEGDVLYISVGFYRQDQLKALAAQTGTTNLTMSASETKRKYGETAYAAGAAYVGAGLGLVDNDAFAQLRCWSSKEASHFLAPVPPSEYLDWKAYDRFCVGQEKRMAFEYQEYEYDAATDSMRARDLVAAEGLQEALASIPDLVHDGYMSSTFIIKVGTVKTPMNQPTTMQAILNAHMDHAALAAMPHIDIFQNRA